MVGVGDGGVGGRVGMVWCEGTLRSSFILANIKTIGVYIESYGFTIGSYSSTYPPGIGVFPQGSMLWP